MGYSDGFKKCLMTTQVLTNVTPDALWLSVNPSFRRLEQSLVAHLNSDRTVAHWGYCQMPDEPSSLDGAVTLLHDYVKGCDRPLHLIGHSTGGLIGLLYARRFPHRVTSLTLLGVGVNPAVDWKVHYYTQLELLPCSRTRVLTQMVHSLFGLQCQYHLKGFIELLERDLVESLSLHSLMKRSSLSPGGVPMPLLICGGQDDVIVDPMQLQGWQPWLKEGDRIWLCPNGRHFFYTDHLEETATEILDFWNEIDGAGSIQLSDCG